MAVVCVACPRQALFGMHQRFNTLLDTLFNQENPNGPVAPHPHTPPVLPNPYGGLPYGVLHNPYGVLHNLYGIPPMPNALPNPAANPYAAAPPAAYPYATYPYVAGLAAAQQQLQPGGAGGVYPYKAPRRPKGNRGGHQR